MLTLSEIRRCIKVLSQTPTGEWAKTFVDLKMSFYRKYQHPYIFSTKFGADFFEELQEAVENNKFIYPNQNEILSDCDKNFNIWLKQVCTEK